MLQWCPNLHRWNSGYSTGEGLLQRIVDEEEPFWSDQECRDYLSAAVIAVGPDGDSVLLHNFGPAIDWHTGEFSHSTEELGLDGMEEPGIWVWVGDMGSERHETIDGVDYDHVVIGEWREPTDEEWEAIRAGECPWTKETLPKRKGVR